MANLEMIENTYFHLVLIEKSPFLVRIKGVQKEDENFSVFRVRDCVNFEEMSLGCRTINMELKKMISNPNNFYIVITGKAENCLIPKNACEKIK
jgi:hypothetical protein